MKEYQSNFLQTCLQHNILKFGEFKLKSGRISPYFFNAGLFCDGILLSEISRCYAQLLIDSISDNYMLYGPAYKGIPLAVNTASQLYEKHNLNVKYAFNRKEAKDHGEGGIIVGSQLADNVVIVDDVITAGTSVQESINLIVASGAKPHSVIVALDRQERMGEESMSSVEKIEQSFGIPVYSLIKLDDLIEYISEMSEFSDHFTSVSAYRSEYGISGNS